MRKFVASAALATAVVMSATLVAFAPTASAATVTESFSGSFGIHPFSGGITLDVVGGQAISGTGIIDIFGLSNAPMVLITPSTPGNEASPGPVGFRGNDGTDFGGLNTVIPIDTIGLLFDVGTNTAVFGAFPLLNLAFGPNDSTFTGKVNGTEFFDVIGSATISTTPLPSTWTMLIAGFAGFGFLAYRGTKKSSVALAAA